YDADAYRYEGAALKKAWGELHRGDGEPFPDAAFVRQAFARHPRLRGRARPRQGRRGAESALARLSSRRFRRGDRGRDGARANRRQRRQPWPGSTSAKDDGADPPELQAPQDRLKNVFEPGYKLLNAIKRVPGHDDLGELKTDRLAKWIATVRQSCAELSRCDIADICL